MLLNLMTLFVVGANIHAVQPHKCTIHLGKLPGIEFINSNAQSLLGIIYKKVNCQFEATALPVKRVDLMANFGKIDGILARSGINDKGLTNLYRIPTPIGEFKWLAYVKKDLKRNITIKEVLEKSNLKIGVRLGSRVENLLKNKILYHPTSNKALFEMLINNRLDVAIAASGVYEDLIKKASDKKRTKLNSIVQLTPLNTKPYYHYLHIKHKKLGVVIDKELRNYFKSINKK